MYAADVLVILPFHKGEIPYLKDLRFTLENVFLSGLDMNYICKEWPLQSALA